MFPNSATRYLSALLVGVLIVGSGPVWADPCGMVPPFQLTGGTPELTRVGDQITFVFFKDGIEDIVLRPAFEGSVSDFGMLIPFPAVPALRKVSDDIFGHVAKAIEPPEVVIDLRPQFKAKRAFVGRLVASEADQLMLMDQVTVLKEEAVGMYQVAVLEATNPMALKVWMDAHGYVYPDGMDCVCQEYMDAKWCFVAVKANVGSKQAVAPRPGMRDADTQMPEGSTFAGAVQAMGFRFEIDRPVVPMRLSAFNAGELHNIVYFLSDEPHRIDQLSPDMIKMQIPGARLLKNLTEPLPVKVLGGTLEQVEKMGWLNLPQYDRDPTPHNGHALDLFAADLLAVREHRLSHDFEEREKELLKIGERLGLRGPEVDERIAEIVAAERKAATRDVLADLEGLTLTVIEGDFPRDVIAQENLTFSAYHGPVKKGTEQGSVQPVSPQIQYASLGGIFALLALAGLGLLLGHRSRRLVVLLLAVALATQTIVPVHALGPDLDLDALIETLSDASRAEESAARLVALGKAAVPHLIGAAVEGPTSPSAAGRWSASPISATLPRSSRCARSSMMTRLRDSCACGQAPR